MDIVQFVGDQVALFGSALADDSKQGIDWKREQQFAIQAFQKNDYLAKIAMQNPISAQNAIINIASVGISLNPALKHAYLVPREGGVCLDISYMGLMHLAQMSGVIRWGQAKIVYANDNYQSNGLDVAPSHKYQAFVDRGDPVGVYCTVKTADGDYITEEMSKEQVHAIRARSPGFKSGKKSPWTTDELEMWRKTCVKRAYKYWPKCERLATAIDVLNNGGEGINFDEKNITPTPSNDYGMKLASLFDGKPREKYLPWLSQGLGRDITSLSDITAEESVSLISKMENAKS